MPVLLGENLHHSVNWALDGSSYYDINREKNAVYYVIFLSEFISHQSFLSCSFLNYTSILALRKTKIN